ncbi:MAG: metallophosphoesterase, partial [Clostridia bacterium]
TVTVGVFGDFQLPANGADSYQQEKLRKGLQYFRDAKVDVLVNTGDTTDLGTAEAWQSYQRTFKSVFPDKKPILSYAIGNHDYWLGDFFKDFEIPTPAKMQRRFSQYTGELPYTHKIVNGFHFITWSSSNGSYDKSYRNLEKMKEQLDSAVASDPNRPIFVTTHLGGTSTSYCNDEWGNDDIFALLKNYPQVINLSGHVHSALEDERSMWQGEYTAVNTQATDYIELEGGRYNGTIPLDAYGNSIAIDNPVGLLIEVNKKDVTIRRVNLATGEETRAPWIVSTPFNNVDNFLYTDTVRKATNKKPTFPSVGELNASIANEKSIDGKDIKTLTFNSFVDDDFVHSYSLQFLDAQDNVLQVAPTKYKGETKDGALWDKVLYFSDFPLGISRMSALTKLRLPPNIPTNCAKIAISALDSFGLESEQWLIAYN